MTDPLSQEFKTEVRKQAKQQAAKWVIGGGVAFIGFAVSGWILAAKPYVDEYIQGQVSIGDTVSIPKDAVVAFDRPPSNPCPDGWGVFQEATSRTIVGAGNADNFHEEGFKRDEYGNQLSPRAYREPGGAETVAITINEMPTHSHSYQSSFGPNMLDNRANVNHGEDRYQIMAQHNTSPVGHGAAHNNMPPFVALYYCKKD